MDNEMIFKKEMYTEKRDFKTIREIINTAQLGDRYFFLHTKCDLEMLRFLNYHLRKRQIQAIYLGENILKIITADLRN